MLKYLLIGLSLSEKIIFGLPERREKKLSGKDCYSLSRYQGVVTALKHNVHVTTPFKICIQLF